MPLQKVKKKGFETNLRGGNTKKKGTRPFTDRRAKQADNNMLKGTGRQEA